VERKWYFLLTFAVCAAALGQSQPDQARAASERAHEAQERAREARERLREAAERDNEGYRAGTRAVERRRYDDAIAAFDRVIASKSPRADGAYYWKAYAQNKLGKRTEALATLGQLEKAYPQSRWLNDAKALQVEIKQAAGQPVAPESESDEELKLLALNNIMMSDPEKAIPVLEKVLRDAKASPQLKQRALFVLAQSRDPRARSTIVAIAKGAANPDLQLRAVEFLGVTGRDSAQALSEIYSSTTDVNVKRAVLRGYMMSQNRERLLAAAKSEQNPELRGEAVRLLGMAHGQDELAQLYASESSAEVRRDILRGLMMAQATAKLAELARNEKDATLRREAIHMLGMTHNDEARKTLLSMYNSESDKGVKSAIVNALFMQQDAKTLIDLARKESDPSLKKEIVSRLAMLKSKDASDYMMEILNK
jgi:tetratricopeptide (TPR) repeat protein